MRSNFQMHVGGAGGRSATDLHDQVAEAQDQGEAAKPLAVLFEGGQTIELQRGEFLFHRGDTDRRLFVVLTGSVDVVVEGAGGGQEQTLGRFGN